VRGETVRNDRVETSVILRLLSRRISTPAIKVVITADVPVKKILQLGNLRMT